MGCTSSMSTVDIPAAQKPGKSVTFSTIGTKSSRTAGDSAFATSTWATQKTTATCKSRTTTVSLAAMSQGLGEAFRSKTEAVFTSSETTSDEEIQAYGCSYVTEALAAERTESFTQTESVRGYYFRAIREIAHTAER